MHVLSCMYIWLKMDKFTHPSSYHFPYLIHSFWYLRKNLGMGRKWEREAFFDPVFSLEPVFISCLRNSESYLCISALA
jgi:hypothetical protein